MDSLMTLLGITAVENYEYLYFILEGCLAVFIVMELIGWTFTLIRTLTRR